MNDNKIRISVMSDLHVEFQDEPYGSIADLSVIDADLILLVGDIWSKGRTARWVEEYANVCEAPVIWVAGNHEFYGAKIEKSLAEFRATCRNSRQVHFLENDVVKFTVRGRRVRVLGCTLWTDYDLFGNPMRGKMTAGDFLNDHRAITEDSVGYSKFRPDHAQKRHFLSRMWLQEQLLTPFDGVTVVMTHHLPHIDCVPERFKHDSLSAAFASDLSELIVDGKPDLWVHGHTHDSVDTIIGDTRIVCNPRGYIGVEPNLDFDPYLIVEV